MDIDIIDAILCDVNFEGCGTINKGVNINKCIRCNKILKTRHKNSEGKILYLGQNIFFYAEIIRKGFVTEIINRSKTSDIVVRYEEKQWDKKNYDQMRHINDIFTDINSITQTNDAADLYPTKRQRKEKKLYDPDSGNLEGEFVGNELYASNRTRKKNADDKKRNEINETEFTVIESQTLSYDQDIENNQKNLSTEELSIKKKLGRPKKRALEQESNEVLEEISAENIRFPIKKLGRPKKVKIEQNEEEQLNELSEEKKNEDMQKKTNEFKMRANELMKMSREDPLPPPKKRLGRPRKEDQCSMDHSVTEIVDDSKRKRKKKEFFEPNNEREPRKNNSSKSLEKASIEYRIEKNLTNTKTSKIQMKNNVDSNEPNKPKNLKQTKAEVDFLNFDFTSRPIDFLLASCDFSSAVPVKKSFHGRYLDSHFKKALLHYLYFWLKPPEISLLKTVVAKDKLKKTEKGVKSNITIAEIQEILFFCPIDVSELNTLKRCKRLLGILVTEDCTLGKLLTDRIRKFLRNRNCYDDGLQSFLYPHNVANLLSMPLNTQLSELKSMNLKIPLSSTCFNIIMNYVLRGTSKNDKCSVTEMIIESTSLGKSSVFMDLSCGKGIQSIQVAAMTGCKCYAIESNNASLEAAIKLAEEFHRVLRQLNINEALKIEFINGNVFDHENDEMMLNSNVIFWDNSNIREEDQAKFTSRLSKIYCNSFNIKQVITSKHLFDKNLGSKEPSREITFESFDPLNFYYITKESFPCASEVGSHYSLERCSDTLIDEDFSNNFEVIDENVVVTDNFEAYFSGKSEAKKTRRLYKNRSTYIGELKNNRHHGKGVLMYPHTNKLLRVSYEGDWSNDKIEGRGKMTYKGNEVYDGEWLNEMKHGTGTYTWPDGKVYNGSWVAGLMNGKGMLQYSKKESVSGRLSYEGDFKDDIPHGKGTIVFQNGSKYEGSIVQHSMKGTGALLYPEGDIRLRSAYLGEFLNDNFEGYGILKYTDGKKYEGIWSSGRKNGSGIFYYAPDDSKKRIKFEGIFQKDKVYDGEMVYKDGRAYRGKWKHELPHGRGVAIFPTISYKGQWLAGLPHGEGVLFKNDDKQVIRQGEWKNGIFQSKNSEEETLTTTYQEELIYFKEL